MVRNVKKKVRPQRKNTLDQRHCNHLKTFEKQRTALPIKKKKLARLKEELNEYSRRNRSQKYSQDDIHKQSALEDEIRLLEHEIKNIENHTDSLKYAVDVLDILADYYDSNNQCDDADEIYESMQANNTGSKKGIAAYFDALPSEDVIEKNTVKKGSGSKTNAKKTPNKQLTKTVVKTKTTTVTKTVTYEVSKPKVSKTRLYENYLSVTDPTYKNPNKNWYNKCSDPSCKGEKVLCQNDGCIVCNVCGDIESTLTAVEKPNYKEPIQDTGTYAYKRINHLTEILSQLQAKESTEIPKKIYESILHEIRKRKIDKNELDVFSLRRILKKLDFIKYYEHVPHILQYINGKKPPNFSREDEQKIKKMFKDIQKPFSIYCPKNRKNFLNYSYVLHKFCELLNLDEYIPYFPLLKNNSKLLQHDRIWKNICGYMKWAYYKSI